MAFYESFRNVRDIKAPLSCCQLEVDHHRFTGGHGASCGLARPTACTQRSIEGVYEAYMTHNSALASNLRIVPF